MTRTISLVAVVGTALVLTAQAAGKGQPVEPQWQQALVERSQALNEQYGLGSAGIVRQGPMEAHTAGLQSTVTNTQYVQSGTNVLDARERAFAAKHEAQLGTDAFVRALQLRGQALNETQGLGGTNGRDFVAGDDHFVGRPVVQPTETPASTPSGTEIEWPGIGIGAFMGLLLLAGITLALRRTRVRPLAH
jgi:hypothetical protein